jgi:hypothetical protein
MLSQIAQASQVCQIEVWFKSRITYVVESHIFVESNPHGRIWGISSTPRVSQKQVEERSASPTRMSQSEVSRATVIHLFRFPKTVPTGVGWALPSHLVLSSEH